MSKKPLSGKTSRKISTLARKLKASGYSVRSSSGRFVSPNPIRGIVPDIVARRGDRTIVVEVKRTNEVVELGERLGKLATYADENRNVRFDFVVVPENSGKKWDVFEVKRLQALARQNTPTRVIGLKLGRTMDSIYKKASTYNISLAPLQSDPFRHRRIRLLKKKKKTGNQTKRIHIRHAT